MFYSSNKRSPHIVLADDAKLPHSIGSCLRLEEEFRGNMPSRIFTLAHIYIPPEMDDWNLIDFRTKHPCYWRPRFRK